MDYSLTNRLLRRRLLPVFAEFVKSLHYIPHVEVMDQGKKPGKP